LVERLLADWLRRSSTEVSRDSISRLLRRFGIQRHVYVPRRPELEAKVRDVVGLYLNPPENTTVWAYPGRELHIVSDKYATYKHPTVPRVAGPQTQITTTAPPTGGSWLNMVEIYFGIILTRR
jgi:hypothetical protein